MLFRSPVGLPKRDQANGGSDPTLSLDQREWYLSRSEKKNKKKGTLALCATSEKEVSEEHAADGASGSKKYQIWETF